MGVGNKNKIDMLLRSRGGDVELLILDYGPWDVDYKERLQEKVEHYLLFLESGQINEHVPEAQRSSVTIVLRSGRMIRAAKARPLIGLKKPWRSAAMTFRSK